MESTSLVQPDRQAEHFETAEELPGTLEVPEIPSVTTRNANIYRGFWTSPRGERVEVAIKEFKTPIPKDRTLKQEALTRKTNLRLKREAFAWSRTTHPNIHPLIGYCSQPRPRLISPWCRYGNLNDYLGANQGLTRCDKLRLIFQTACGLEHLHSRTPPICHADIKPENVLINDWNGPAVSDFGLSRVSQDLEVPSGFTTSETVKGSVRYMARELFSGQKPSLKTDVYAFGGLILTVMSGKAPFDGLFDHVILRRVMQDEPPIPGDHPDLPAYDPLWKLMRRCWSSDPEARPAMHEVLKELLGEISHEEFISGSPRHPDSVTDDDAGGQHAMDVVISAAVFRSQAEPNNPTLRTGRQLPLYPTQKSLTPYRTLEGAPSREARLHSIWLKLPKRHPPNRSEPARTSDGPPEPLQYEDMTKERAESLQDFYWDELMRRASLDWEGFLTYADQKEEELWSFFHEQLDLDGNDHLDAVELAEVLSKAGIRLTASQLSDFMTCLTSTQDPHPISFPEFRDFFLLLPWKTSTVEMYRYYAVRRFLGNDGHSAAQVNLEDEAPLSTEERHPVMSPVKTLSENSVLPLHTSKHGSYDDNEKKALKDSDPPASSIVNVGYSPAVRFLLIGGIAGAVCTATAPLDRLKVFLITSSRLPASNVSVSQNPKEGVEALRRAMSKIHSEAGMRSFWIGNGLNVFKVFPEIIVRLLSYEASKRFMAKHVDQVEDIDKISGISRFISGSIGLGISQLSIYPVETLRIQMMSRNGHAEDSLSSTLKRTWNLGGVPALYRGLSIGLAGAVPYLFINLYTLEILNRLYLRSTGIQEPGSLALIAFGSLSGTVGATSVYPLNVVRTRLQAAGSPGHPQRYTGFRDAVFQTYKQVGWKGFYAGLVPTLAKVIPAVSISYVVYEKAKQRLGIDTPQPGVQG